MVRLKTVDLIMGEGPVPCDGMIIGEAPGKDEDKAKRPFVGRSGKLLEEALNAFGVKRTSVYITNAYKLRPPFNATPTARDVAKHSPYLQEELTNVNPKAILTLGAVSTGVFLDVTTMTAIRGKLKKMGDWVIIPTWHPAYVLRNDLARDEFYQDIEKFRDTLRSLASE